jgi:hypothetical protein
VALKSAPSHRHLGHPGWPVVVYAAFAVPQLVVRSPLRLSVMVVLSVETRSDVALRVELTFGSARAASSGEPAGNSGVRPEPA